MLFYHWLRMQVVIKEIDILQAWKQFLGIECKNYFYSLGVRHSLEIIFDYITTISLPDNPVYLNIAKHCGTTYHTYQNYEFDFSDKTLLITAPNIRDLNDQEIDLLLRWLGKSESYLLIIDRVYNNRINNNIQKLINTNQVIVCYSLSKSHLSPNLMGFNVTPVGWNEDITIPQENIDKAKMLLLSKYYGNN